MTVTALRVDLPDAEHSHFDPVANRFVNHSHPHAGAHQHGAHNGRTVIEHGPGNYSPKASR